MRAPRIPEYTDVPIAARVMDAFTMVFVRLSGWANSRDLFAKMSPAPPIPWMAMAPS